MGIFVERPMYFRYSSAIDGGHVGRGADRPGPRLALRRRVHDAGFDQYLTILNPDSRAAAVTVTYFLTDGTTQTRTLTVAPTSRRTIVVHETAEGVGRGKEVAARVETTNGVDIIAERPMYFRYTLSDGSDRRRASRRRGASAGRSVALRRGLHRRQLRRVLDDPQPG